MTYAAFRPVLIVEGQGDTEAMPDLIRRVAYYRQIYGIQPQSPAIRKASLGGFKNVDNLGKFVRLAALRPNADSIVIALDCDDGCAKNEVAALSTLLNPLAQEVNKKIGVCFFVREFESLFLHCLEELSQCNPTLDIQLPCPISPDKIEEVRAAKQVLDRQMQGGSYKETRDQQKFVHHLDIEKLLARSRSLKHLSNCLDFLQNANSPLVYP